MRGLLAKTLREVWLPTVLFGVGLAAIKALLTFVMPQVQQGMGEILEQVPLARTLLTAMLGTELGKQISAQTMQAFLWVHPTVLALIWAHEIVLCTRIPAGEIDRGTIDILLGLPVSRRKVYACESIVWVCSGVLVLAMGLVGHRLAAPAMPDAMRPALYPVILVMLNLFCVYLAVGGIALLVSTLSDRRGRAVAVVFGIVLASFLLNFLAQFWSPAKNIAFLSVMQYYQPAVILRSEQVPLSDMVILLLFALTTWLAAGEVFARRSICTI